MENKVKATCVQCGEPMEGLCDVEKYVPICTKKECPNFGVLQLGVEIMNKFNKK